MARRTDLERELQTLIQAQAAVRDQQVELARLGARRAFAAVRDWRDPKQTAAAVKAAVKIVTAAQRRVASSTDAYMARSTTAITGRRSDTVGAVDVRSLRRKLPQDVIEHLAEGKSVTEALASRAQKRIEAVAPEETYGRIADHVRFISVSRGISQQDAALEGLRRAAAVADTDVMLAERAQVTSFLSQRKPRGVVGYRRVLHPELGSGAPPCGLCVVAATRIYHIEELMPIHARCVPAGTRVAAKGVSAISRRQYSGALVVLLTASGQEMTITANHPVLTSQGWIPAHLVGVGDEVVRHLAGEGVVGRGPAERDGPILVEDVWRAAAVNGTLHRAVMPLAAEDFHGDWSQGEVEVVTTNGNLAPIGDVSFVEPSREFGFVPGHSRGVLLPSQSDLDGLRFGHLSTAASRVGGTSYGRSLLTSAAHVSLVAAFGATADVHTGLLQASTNQRPTQAVLLGEHQFANSGTVLLDDFLDDAISDPVPLPARFDPAFAEYAEDGRVAYAQLGGDLLGRLAGHIQLDRVIEQRLVYGTHHVYNLHTDEGWYSANNLIVSNCRCSVSVVTKEADPGLVLNDQDLKTLLSTVYSAAGGNTRNQLKTVRVEIAEHGELGPILVNADQNFRGPSDFARTQSRDQEKKWLAELEALQEQLIGLVGRAGESSEVDAAIKWNKQKIRELSARLP
jgi:hypothetical protein